MLPSGRPPRSSKGRSRRRSRHDVGCVAIGPPCLHNAAMTTGAHLELGDDPDAVPRARRFAAEVLRGHAARSDAELAVTELVTNALLHGEQPVVLRLLPMTDAVRIEVQDSGRAAP